ncbi:MAG: radical SAM protein [Prevotellaceae bacterium]|nr:radical SAM protein [Prevotellaceae bacterium]
MIIRTLPYILYRDYPEFGYLTDNRSFGYDTASRSCIKVGELLLSKTGSTFYSILSDDSQEIDSILTRLYQLYPNISSDIIRSDATEFYQTLHSKGFIYWGEEAGYSDTIMQRFSYNNRQPYELNVQEEQSTSSVYQDTFGGRYQLSRVHIDVSSRCNEHCIHCYIPNKNKCSIMTGDLFYNVLRQCKEMNVLNLTISGGEPMLNPQLKDFLLACQEQNFSVNLLSNLTLLTDELLGIIANYPILSIQTSLYAMNPEIHDSITGHKGSFIKTIGAIKTLHELDIPLQINCPIMKQNRYCYKEVLEYASSLNIEADADYSLYGCYDSSCGNLTCRLSIEEIETIIKEDISNKSLREKIEDTIKSKKVNDDTYICPVCKSSLCISNSGVVYPCEGWQSLSLGSLTDSNLREIWENSTQVNQLRTLTYEDLPECSICADRKFCTTCLIMNANEDEHGDYRHVNTFMCSVARLKKDSLAKC